MRKTEKLYYAYPYAKKIRANIMHVHITEKTIELDRTIAYPEGGGQESDKGIIMHMKTGHTYPFDYVKRIYGRDVQISESHYVNVEGVILHHITSEHTSTLDDLQAGDEVTVEIDSLLREKLTTSHTAAHLLYLAADQVRKNITSHIIGCHIKTDTARFDFRTTERFCEQEIQQIEVIANRFISEDHDIKLYPSTFHPDARFWECADHSIPCGGTHTQKTGIIGRLGVRRKSIGNGKERLICTLDTASYTDTHYKEYLDI